jgi:hypothetical protein
MLEVLRGITRVQLLNVVWRTTHPRLLFSPSGHCPPLPTAIVGLLLQTVQVVKHAAHAHVSTSSLIDQSCINWFILSSVQ